jgi:hypothetical protein
MPTKKPSKKSPAKKHGKRSTKELKDADLDKVVGGATEVTPPPIPLDEYNSRRRPGRVKSLHP